MSFPTLLILLLAVSSAFYFFGRKRALASVGGHTRKLHSLPGHYGYYVALWAGLPALLVLLLWFGHRGAAGRLSDRLATAAGHGCTTPW